MNPEIHLASLEDNAKIDLEVQIEKGRGYIPAEMDKSSDVIGVIPVDALFSPIKKVNMNVADTRVGQRTDYDKLELEVWTDGSIKPDDALAQAAKIIKDHMTIFINFEEEVEDEMEVVDENLEKMRQLLNSSVDEMEFSVRTYNTIRSLEINTLEQLVRKTEDELYKSKHFSDQVSQEIKEKLESKNLNLGLKE
jgi:DNA-directed RNA polymerase subunit alpha